MEEEPHEEDIFKILIATDNHLGYNEKKEILQQDSFRTFEEILKYAVENNVDFILLGGDLFHESQPSSYCINKCSELLKKYCLGDKPVVIEFLSDQSEHFSHLKNPIVNYEDPNINISIPVFSIHGNHDSPTGNHLVSPLDILSCNGLINYFGRWTDLTKIEIKPILLKKGKTKLALYGLSHIPDQRLARLFCEKKVKMLRVQGDDWFNILVLHQNRADRGAKNFIPYSAVPSFINLVIWGHEHDCIKTMEPRGDSWIYQPGSSVATSLAEGESQQKHIGLLQVYESNFKFIALPLKSVRPFIFSDIVLCNPDSDEYDLDNSKGQAIEAVKAKVEEMLEKAAKRQEATLKRNTPFLTLRLKPLKLLDSGNPPLLPLIRLIVRYYTEVQTFNSVRLGHEYDGRVANPADMFKISRFIQREREKRIPKLNVEDDEFLDVDDWATRVEDVVEKFFENSSRNDEMKVLSAKLLTRAVARYIDVSDNDAVVFAYKQQVKTTIDMLLEKNPSNKEIADCLITIKEERQQNEDKEVTKLLKDLEDENRTPLQTIETNNVSDDERDIIHSAVSSIKPARGKGSRGGRGSRRSRTPRGGTSRA